MENKEVLEYKNQSLFYTNLYTRLFDLIEELIDEKSFNIIKIKSKLEDFFDNYSYYLMKKELITRENNKLEKENVLVMLKRFDSFYDCFNKFPSSQFNKIRFELINKNNNLIMLNNDNYNYLMREYYSFFDIALNKLKEFVDVCSLTGFLPNVKTKTSLKNIGYANFNEFFMRLESLKLKLSEITSNIKLNNIFKARRCLYSILIIFSPYFRKLDIFEELKQNLDYSFINEDSILKDLKKSLEYPNNKLPVDLRDKIDKNILNELKTSSSIIKRYLSYELGERDMSPKVKKKYGYDPTGV